MGGWVVDIYGGGEGEDLTLHRTRFERLRSLWQGKRAIQDHAMTLHTFIPNQCHFHILTLYILYFSRYGQNKILKVKVTIPRSNIISKSHNHIAHIHPPTNAPTMYELPVPQDF